MLQGDEEEHAVLLTNYFLGINKKAWLLIGCSKHSLDIVYQSLIIIHYNYDFVKCPFGVFAIASLCSVHLI